MKHMNVVEDINECYFNVEKIRREMTARVK
jgi:hypothetical protein